MFQYVAQKVDTVVYTLKLCFLKIAQKVTTYLGYVLLNLITKNFKIIPQSGHTDSVVTFNLSLSSFHAYLPTHVPSSTPSPLSTPHKHTTEKHTI